MTEQDLNDIRAYFYSLQPSGKSGFVDQKIADDIDLDRIFTQTNETKSTIGKQYLYSCLRTFPPHISDSRFDFINTPIEPSLQEKLEELHKVAGYSIFQLFDPDYLKIPRWSRYTFHFPYLITGLFLLSFLHGFFMFCMLAVFVLNIGLHLWNKSQIHRHRNLALETQKMTEVARYIHDKLQLEDKPVLGSVSKLEKLKRHTWIFKSMNVVSDDLMQVFWMFIDILNALFLVGVRKSFRAIDLLKNCPQEIKTLFLFIGRVDFAVNYQQNFSKNIHITQPVFLPETQLGFTNLTHPLLKMPVANTYRLTGKSCLITGSNMSGKSTFIRSIAVNAILAKCLGFCFAEKFSLGSSSRVFTLFRVSDNLLQSKSYYQEEVNRVKEIVANAKTGDLVFLDEIFKGTNRRERLAICMATLLFLAKKGVLVFASTHDIELADSLSEYFDNYHFTETYDESGIAFDYLLKTGKSTHTNAIKILEINDYPEELIDNARRLFDGL